MIRIPVQPGLAPDPSVLRAEGRWFVATSTLEWYPGSCGIRALRLVLRDVTQRRPQAVQRIFDENSLPEEVPWLATPDPDRSTGLIGTARHLTGRQCSSNCCTGCARQATAPRFNDLSGET